MGQDRVLRVIDANLNRAIEGIRVVDDISRFILEDGHVAARLKDIRHEIARGVKDIFPGRYRLLKARNVRRDTGAFLRSKSELKRKDPREILDINLKRAGEALRVLEEFAKLFDPHGALFFKKLRFEVYSLQKELITSCPSILSRRLSGLYVIVDRSLVPGGSYLRITREAIKGGAGIIQLRAKGLPDRGLMKMAVSMRKVTRKGNAIFIINDRVDVCLAVDADGVHLGSDDMLPRDARKMLGRDKIIGLSTHGMSEAVAGARMPVDYLSIGPVFHTCTKPELKPVGLKVISSIKKRVDVALFGIGGINGKNAGKVKRTGADGVAVISAVMKARGVVSAARILKRSIGG